MFNSILVVCVGNICRSPTGERLLQKLLPEKEIASAGIGALVGQPMDDLAAEIATQHGLNPSGHVARQLTPEICRQADIILAMSKQNIKQICQISPESRGKVMLYGRWMDDTEIPDPYRREWVVYEQAFKLLDEGARAWLKALQRS
jgi:protein-tyrosine phosphatase